MAAAIPALAGIGAAIAFACLRGGGALGRTARTWRHANRVDPFEDTGRAPSIDEDDPHAPPRDEPGYDGGCLRLGKKHFRFGDPYRVCLTANQEKKLFRGQRRKMRKLGCGVFACAYESPAKSRVVKFTRDEQDVAALLQAQKSGVVPKVFAVYKLAQGGRTIPKRDPFTMRLDDPEDVSVYALVVEKLRTVPPSEREMVDDELLRVREGLVEGKQSGNDFCDAQVDEDGNTGCSDVQLHTVNAYEKLKQLGIDWTDMHAGNIGYDRNGRLKVLDLSLTKTELEKEPEVLEGRLAAARKRLAGLVPV